MLAKVPAERRDELKAAFWEIFNLPEDIEAGEAAVRAAQAGIDAFARRYEREFPAAVKCLPADRQALTVYLRFPPQHWKRIRHTNLIERTFGETRRRVKVIGRLPGEPPASHSYGPCSTGHHKAGAASPTHPPSPDTSPSCDTASSDPTTPNNHQPLTAVTQAAQHDHPNQRPTPLLHRT